jgi:hypothetical protein
MISTKMKEKKNHKISFRLGDKLHTELMEEALKQSQNLTRYIVSVLEKRTKKDEVLTKVKPTTNATNSVVENWFFGLLFMLILAIYVRVLKRK